MSFPRWIRRVSPPQWLAILLPCLTFLAWNRLVGALPLTPKAAEAATIAVMLGGLVGSGLMLGVVLLPLRVARFVLLAFVVVVGLVGLPQGVRWWPVVREMESTGGRFATDEDGTAWLTELPDQYLGVSCVGGRIQVRAATVQFMDGRRLPMQVDTAIPRATQADDGVLRVDVLTPQIAAEPDTPVRRTITLRVPRAVAGQQLKGVLRLDFDCPRRTPLMGVPAGAAGPSERVVGGYDGEDASASLALDVRVPTVPCYDAASGSTPWGLLALLVLGPASLMLFVIALRASA